MKKGTKVLYGLLIVGGLLTMGVCAGLIGLGTVAAGPTLMYVLDAGLLAGAIGVVSGVVASAVTASRVHKKRKSNKIQATRMSEFSKTNQLEKAQQKAMVKSHNHNLKCCKNFFKGMVYGAENGTGLLRLRYRPGITQKQMNEINKLDAYTNLNAYAMAEGKNHLAKVAQKKAIKAETKLDKLGVDVSSIENRYDVTYSTYFPYAGNVKDYRTGAGLNNSKYRDEFTQLMNSDESIARRYNSANKKDYGYVAEIDFLNRNAGTKKTYVMSNAQEEMDQYELILLKDYKETVNTELNGKFEPFKIVKTHFTGPKNSNAKVNGSVTINNMEQLDKRINTLESYVQKDNKVKAVGKDYLKRSFKTNEQKQKASKTKDEELNR